MTNPSKYFTLRDSATPTTTVNLYMVLRQTAGSTNVFNNTKHILDNGDITYDYGTDKRVWNLRIDVDKAKTTWFTASDLTKIETLYALRTIQTIQLVDNWKEAAEIITVHFPEFQKTPHSQTGCYTYTLKLVEK